MPAGNTRMIRILILILILNLKLKVSEYSGCEDGATAAAAMTVGPWILSVRRRKKY